MDLAQLDRAEKKKLIEAFIKEDPSLFKELLQELLEEQNSITTLADEEGRKILEAIIESTFDKYDAVFKRLA